MPCFTNMNCRKRYPSSMNARSLSMAVNLNDDELLRLLLIADSIMTIESKQLEPYAMRDQQKNTLSGARRLSNGVNYQSLCAH